METDSFFYQLLKEVPGTLFERLDLPSDRAQEYQIQDRGAATAAARRSFI